ANSAGLAEDGQTLCAAPLQSLQAAPVDFRILAGRHDGVVQHWSLGYLRQLFEEGQVGLDMTSPIDGAKGKPSREGVACSLRLRDVVWKDREDITDGQTFARQLRRLLATQGKMGCQHYF
ncbi:MAG: hypothetical protein HYZ72_08690, partial [Deltaproteobacteria bacterium]|nr:hypothetical protein [Deltaproteobacteria bacterium]